MFAPNLRRKMFGWLERLKNSAGIRLTLKKIRRRRGAFPKIRRGGWRRRLRGLLTAALCTECRLSVDVGDRQTDGRTAVVTALNVT